MKATQKLLHLFKYLLPLFFLIDSNRVFAQMPDCNTIYVHAADATNEIYNWNPTQPFSPANLLQNSIAIPGTLFESNGLAVVIGLSATNGVTPVFYTNRNGHYTYYNGTNWVNTGHIAHTINLGGGVGVVYAFDGESGTVYKYDGTGDDVPLITIPDFNSGGPFDIVVDCANNFYILKQTTPSSWLRKYSPTGVMLQQWTVTGAPNIGSGGGFAVLGNTIYTATGGLYTGTIAGTTIALTEIQNAPNNVFGADYASCPFSVQASPPASFDTVYACSATTSITSNGIAPYSYQILDGTATVTSAGANFIVNPATPTTIVLHSTGDDNCFMGQSIHDTFLVIPAPIVDAGSGNTLSGCSNFTGTLNGSLTNTIPWINYNLSWTPVANIGAGSNTLTPTITPTQNTMYKLTVSTDNEHGNCHISDSVLVLVNNQTTISDFSYLLKKGCTADTIIFTNKSLNTNKYTWDFGDGSMIDTTQNPVHIYPTQGLYSVTLTTQNGGCSSNITKNIDTKHPLKAMYNIGNDIVCQGSTITFNNISTVTEQPPVYSWFFGDGTQASTFNATHTYNNSGIFNTMLVVSDAIPCFDTSYHTITVDSITPVLLDLSNRNICTGESVNFDAHNGSDGNPQFMWNFGDGNTIQDGNIVTHAFDEPGIFKTNLTVTFRACPDIMLNDSVVVHSFPIVNLGPDTALCLDGKAIPISNLEPAQPGDQLVWNTGETTAATFIKHPGIYKLTVTNMAGCATTDEVDVKKDCYIDIPNSFTPNNDGVNDYFFPRQELSQGVAGFTMQIFDRWGEKIFETIQNRGRGWDGKFNSKDQPQGVYIYIINTVLKNGRTEQYTGNITLLR